MIHRRKRTDWVARGLEEDEGFVPFVVNGIEECICRPQIAGVGRGFEHCIVAGDALLNLDGARHGVAPLDGET